MEMRLRMIMTAGCALLAWAAAAWADTFTGADWIVRFNLPDQTTSPASIGPDEFLIRDAFLERLDALRANDWACLTTYTFSGNTAAGGAAGPMLAAMSNALARGAKLNFVADYGVDVTSNFWPGVSLASLAARKGNALKVSRAPADSGIMHNKIGLFWNAATKKGWVLTGSWNFTGGASSMQWNILTEIQNNDLFAAYSNEVRELLSGRFHANPDKSHAHDGARFRLTGSARDGWVRFAPYPDGRYGGNNALTDITNAVDAAEQEIFFSLNKLNRPNVAEALIRACNRGVIVHGVIPLSDRATPGRDSYEVYQTLLNSTDYTTRNRVRMYDAYYDAAQTRYDGGSRDLVHTKYMVIDPRGANPLVIHGSANWTASALVLTSSNDENVQFLPERGIAEAFLAHFATVSDGFKPWCALRNQGARLWLDYWLPTAESYFLFAAPEAVGPWNQQIAPLPVKRGTNTWEVHRTAPRQFFRIQK